MRLRSALALVTGLLLVGCGGGGGGGTSAPDPLPEYQKGKWTVLVFLNAANDLYTYSPLNVNQMEQVAGNPEVRFVLQWKQTQGKFPASSFDGTRRYLVYPDNTSTVKSHLLTDMGTGVDMGLAPTLRDFVQWGQTHYPADHTLVVVWNHGNGWQKSPDNGRAVSYDDQTGHAIQIWELQAALQGLGVDAVAFDASLMQMAEVAYELKDVTPYVVGSEESPPGEGYPYQMVFKGFQDTPTASTETLLKGFVDGMVNNPAYSTRKITQSVLDTSKLGQVGSSVNALSTVLQGHPERSSEIKAARLATQGYSVLSFRHYYDLTDFCSELQSRIPDADLQIACTNVKAAIASAVIWEGHNANSADSRGLAIDLSNSTQFVSIQTDYEKLSWSIDTTWDDWLAVAP